MGEGSNQDTGLQSQRCHSATTLGSPKDSGERGLRFYHLKAQLLIQKKVIACLFVYLTLPLTFTEVELQITL